MRSALALAAALLVALLLALVPLPFTRGGALAVRSDEGAYRMRMCELALWSGSSATNDRLLEPRAGQAVPYGPFASSASAFVLARTLPRAELDLQAGELDEDALADGAARLFLVLGWIASLALALAGRKFARGNENAAAPSVLACALPALAWTILALAPASDGGS
ncbi:MAG TPA: hypothetical protein VM509_02925, partial [Planctomycetota bacterium]|nr:hypothetical protein [Planctomycetota bacterium]